MMIAKANPDDLALANELAGALEVEYVRKDLLDRDAAEGNYDPA